MHAPYNRNIPFVFEFINFAGKSTYRLRRITDAGITKLNRRTDNLQKLKNVLFI